MDNTVFKIEELKDFLRTNKESIKGKTVIFRWAQNQNNFNTLRGIGTKVIELSKSYNTFYFSQVWYTDESDKCTGIKDINELVKGLVDGSIDSFSLSAKNETNEVDRYKSYGSLD